MPCGSTIEPRTNWSACLASMPSRMAISTDLVELRRVELLEHGHGLIDRHGRLVGRDLLGHRLESFGELGHVVTSCSVRLESLTYVGQAIQPDVLR